MDTKPNHTVITITITNEHDDLGAAHLVGKVRSLVSHPQYQRIVTGLRVDRPGNGGDTGFAHVEGGL